MILIMFSGNVWVGPTNLEVKREDLPNTERYALRCCKISFSLRNLDKKGMCSQEVFVIGKILHERGRH